MKDLQTTYVFRERSIEVTSPLAQSKYDSSLVNQLVEFRDAGPGLPHARYRFLTDMGFADV
jgi:hypothetical protein